MRTLALAGAACACTLVACLGAALLVFVYIARSFAPASAHIVRPLYFDYTQVGATASVSLLDSGSSTYYAHNLQQLNHKKKTTSSWKSQARFLQPGEQITLWLELQVPEPQSEAWHDLFQAEGQLRSADGELVARASRPVLLARLPILLAPFRLFVLAPLSALGLWREWATMQVTLFERYTERADKPFAVFVAALHGRAGGGLPPPVAKASMHMRLHLGMLRRLLYWLRPNKLLTVWLVLAGLAAMLGGAAFAVLFAALWLYAVVGGRADGGSRRGASKPGSAPPGDDDTLSTDSSLGGLSTGELSPDSSDEGEAWSEVAPAAEAEEAGAIPEAEEIDLEGFSVLAPADAGPRLRPRRGSAGDLGAGAGVLPLPRGAIDAGGSGLSAGLEGPRS